MPEEKSPVDQVLDLVVFAPLGLAMTARTQLPEMMAKGRAQVEGQINMARFIGQFAVQQGKVEVEKRLKAFTSPAATPEPEPVIVVPPSASAKPVPEPAAAAAVPAAEPPAGEPAAALSASELAIPGYDALSASQVVQRLAGLSPAELEQVQRYESSTRGRKTVLTKISQLQ